MRVGISRFQLKSTKTREGGRHLAARAISQLADSIAICVSPVGDYSLFQGRERYRVRLS